MPLAVQLPAFSGNRRNPPEIGQFPKSFGFRERKPLRLMAMLAKLGLTTLLASHAHAAPAESLNIIQNGDKIAGKRTYPGYPIMMTDSGVTIFQDFNLNRPRVLAGTPNQIRTILEVGKSVHGGRKISRLYVPGEFYSFMTVNRRGDIAFLAETRSDADGTRSKGLYLLSGGKILPVVESGANAPGGGKFDFFTTTSYQETLLSISNNGKHLVLLAKLAGRVQQAVFRGEIHDDEVGLTRIAAQGTPSPDGGKFIDFLGFLPIVNNQGIILFPALSSGFLGGLGYRWYFIGEKTAGAVPQSIGVQDLIFNDQGQILFYHAGRSGGSLGSDNSLAFGTLDHVKNIAAVGDKAPRGGGIFKSFKYPMLDAAGNVAFTAGMQDDVGLGENHGIYQWVPGHLKTIMLMTDLLPAGSDAGGGIGKIEPMALGVSSGQVHLLAPNLFGGSDEGTGIVAKGDGESLTKIFGVGDHLEGGRILSIPLPFVGGLGALDPNHVSLVGQGAMNARGQFAYSAYTENSGSGIFAYPFGKTPEIAVQQPAGVPLKDGRAVKSFGGATLGATGNTRTFTIKNTGAAALTGLAVSKNGRNARDFTITRPVASSLEPGAQTRFKITFHPTAAGSRRAAIHVTSNDRDEKSFDISVAGTGVE